MSSSALKKMKLIERSVIDSNGKFISKEVKKRHSQTYRFKHCFYVLKITQKEI